MLQDRLAISERRACAIVGQHRSTQRHESIVDDQALRAEVRRLAAKHKRYGYRRIHALLVKDDWRVNRKRIQRIWREEGLRVPKKSRKRRRKGQSTADGAAALKASRPNQVWAIDFQHDATIDGRELKLLNVVDEHTREALAIECSRSITSEGVIDALLRVIGERGCAPENLRMDNGPEFTATALSDWCGSVSTSTVFIEPGSPWQNGYAESFNARVRDELLNVEIFYTLDEAKVLAEDYRHEYNNFHPHSALGMMTPSLFAASWSPQPEEEVIKTP